jgi:MFS family permease
MLAADALRALTQAFVATLLLTETARVWELLILFAVSGVGDAFFMPASTGLVPDTVPPDRLQEANALISVARNTARIGGPVLAGLIVAFAGPSAAFAVDSATFALSGLALGLMCSGASPRVAGERGVLVEFRAGWQEVRSRTWVWAMVLQFSLSNLALAPLFVLGPFVAARSLGGAPAWGAIGACGGVGAVLGNLAALRLKPSRPLLVAGLTVALCAAEPALLARPFPATAIALAAAAGFAAVTFSNTLWFTALQGRIPARALSRVSSFDWLGSLVLQPAGYALAAPAATAIGVSATLLAGAGVQASICVAVALTPAVRRFGVGECTERDVRRFRGRPGAKSDARLVSPARDGS